jgi:hypothetical protein
MEERRREKMDVRARKREKGPHGRGRDEEERGEADKKGKDRQKGGEKTRE